ncbi:cytochrome P450 9e2-like [Periplaneta americana]|uniref:cytochrome P450 9e2-like n=1 Tax=Periplaneta americana TaxID=6978 RepID=UPI0037E73EFB
MWMSFWDWLLPLMGLGLLLYYWGMSTYRRFTKPEVPHLKPLPFIGNLGTMMLKNMSFHDLMSKYYNGLKDHGYGVFFMFRQPTVMISDPELIKAVAVKDFEYFTDRSTTVFENGDPLWRNILINLKGRVWRDMRSTLSPAFTSSKMKMMFVLVSDCCQQFVNFLDECYENTPAKDCIIKKDGDMLILELKDFYTRYTNDVIATTVFGLGVDSFRQPKNEFYTMGQKTLNFGSLRLLLFVSMPKVLTMLGLDLFPRRIGNFFRVIVKDTISTRERKGIIRPDLLHLLMQAKKGILQDENSSEQHKSDRKQLDDEDVVAQAVMFFIAGFDSSSTLLCFVTYLLAVHPDIQARLQKEIDDTLKEGGGKFTHEALYGMKYLDMVVSETLRLYPPIPAVDRLCIRNYTLKSNPPIELVPGDNLSLPVFGLHRDPKYFPDPERFDPERFSDENKHKINPSTYMPFGVGPRICIGNRFALMQTKLAVAYLLSRFNLKVTPKTPIPIIMEQKGFNMTVKGGFWLGLEKRST